MRAGCAVPSDPLVRPVRVRRIRVGVPGRRHGAHTPMVREVERDRRDGRRRLRWTRAAPIRLPHRGSPASGGLVALLDDACGHPAVRHRGHSCPRAAAQSVRTVVAIGITLGVYGAVGLIVTMDDIGLCLSGAPSQSRRGAVRGDARRGHAQGAEGHLPGGFLAWLIETFCSLVLGFLAGSAVGVRGGVPAPVREEARGTLSAG